MAQQQTLVPARWLELLAADLPARVRCPPQIDRRIDYLPAEAPGLGGTLFYCVRLAALGALPRGNDVREVLLGEGLGPHCGGLCPPL